MLRKNNLEIILKRFLKKCDGGRQGPDSSGSGQGQVAVSCERVDEPSSCIKYWEFLNYLKIG